MKPFDLEAAKRGEPIVRYLPSSGETHDVVFLGVRLNGNIVVEYLLTHCTGVVAEFTDFGGRFVHESPHVTIHTK